MDQGCCPHCENDNWRCTCPKLTVTDNDGKLVYSGKLNQRVPFTVTVFDTKIEKKCFYCELLVSECKCTLEKVIMFIELYKVLNKKPPLHTLPFVNDVIRIANLPDEFEPLETPKVFVKSKKCPGCGIIGEPVGPGGFENYYTLYQCIDMRCNFEFVGFPLASEKVWEQNEVH